MCCLARTSVEGAGVREDLREMMLVMGEMIGLMGEVGLAMPASWPLRSDEPGIGGGMEGVAKADSRGREAGKEKGS